MLLSNLNLLATAPGGVARLRELILTLAVQGKLVPQDPSDEPASELLKKIRAEKDRLIAEGKIKRDKPLAEIVEDEKSFELPTGWEWSRVGQIAARVQYGFTASADHAVEQPKLLRITDIQNDKVNWDTVPGVQVGSQDISGYLLADGDLLIARTGGTIGKSFLVDVVPLESIFASYLIRISPLPGLTPPYLKTFASSGHYWSQVLAKSMGTGQPNVNGTALSELVIALPPLAQHAQLVSTLLATLTDSDTPAQLADNWHRIATHFDLLLDRPQAVDALEQTILQLAVRGLLVPQDPQDEPASALLKKIRAEKDKLIAEGKIKRDKPLPPIAEDEQPFALPLRWEWVRVGQVSGRVQYGVTASADHTLAAPKFVRITDIQNDKVNWETVPGMQGVTSDVSDHYLEAGDLLIARTGGTIGKSFLVSTVPINAVFASYLIRISPVVGMDSNYLKIFASSGHYWQQLYAKSMGTGQPNVNGTALSELTLPLPPLAEQSRIVTRVAQLRRLCADLRQRLVTSQSTQSHLAEALVQEVA